MENTVKRERDNCAIRLSEPIADIVVGGILLALTLIVPQIFVLILDGSREFLFDLHAVREAWFTFAGCYLMTLLKALVKIADRRYTFSLAWMTLATNVIAAGLTFYALMVAGVLNPEFFDMLIALMGEIPVVTFIFRNMPLFITACTAFGMTVDIIVTFCKASVCRLSAPA